MKKLKPILVSGIFLLIFGLASAGFISKAHRKNELKKEQSGLVQKKQYVCSMHPQVIRDAPGDCPICGMFLIEKIDQDKNSIDSTLADVVYQVNKVVLGTVNTVAPEHLKLQPIIDAQGIINYDPRKVQTVSARFGGLIEKSFVRYQFQYIKKGQKIFEIYSPDIYTERWNYVKLIQVYPDSDDLTAEALEWFRLLGLSEGQVDSLKYAEKPDYHLAVYSPWEGFAVSNDFDPEYFFSEGRNEEKDPVALLAGTGNIGLNEGIVVETGKPLFKLIDVNSLRIDLKVKTEDCPMLREGQKVIITDAADPEKHFDAFVSQIDPLNGALFQTVKVYLNDKDRILLPGRKINATIIADYHDGLWVPLTTVIDLGEISSVFLKQKNKFVARKIITGLRSKGKVEILEGLDTLSSVAEQALLLIDSDGLVSPD